MLGLVARSTNKFTVFEFARRQQAIGLFVACSTKLGRSIKVVGVVLRHVRIMAFLAIGSRLTDFMRFVARETIRNIAMRFVDTK